MNTWRPPTARITVQRRRARDEDDTSVSTESEEPRRASTRERNERPRMALPTRRSSFRDDDSSSESSVSVEEERRRRDDRDDDPRTQRFIRSLVGTQLEPVASRQVAELIAEPKKVVGLRDHGTDFLEHVKGYVEKLCTERRAVRRRAQDVRKRKRGAEVMLGN